MASRASYSFHPVNSMSVSSPCLARLVRSIPSCRAIEYSQFATIW
jgi:hypothetical protein